MLSVLTFSKSFHFWKTVYKQERVSPLVAITKLGKFVNKVKITKFFPHKAIRTIDFLGAALIYQVFFIDKSQKASTKAYLKSKKPNIVKLLKCSINIFCNKTSPNHILLLGNSYKRVSLEESPRQFSVLLHIDC